MLRIVIIGLDHNEKLAIAFLLMGSYFFILFDLMQRKLLSSYEIETETANYGGANNVLINDQPCKNVA